MSVTDTLQARLAAIYTADTGATGLNNSSSTAYVRAWFYSRDPNSDQRNSQRNWPYVVVNIAAQPMHSSACQKYRMGVQMMVYFDRQSMVNDSSATMFAVVERLRTVFHGVTPATQNDWYFSPLQIRDEREGPANGIELVQIVEFLTYATN